MSRVHATFHLQLTAMYLTSWAVDQNQLRAEAKRSTLYITSLKEQAIAIGEYIPIFHRYH